MGTDNASTWPALLPLALAQSLAMGLWFSAIAVAPALARDWSLAAAQGAWLTMAVQLGFVAGALLSALCWRDTGPATRG